MQKLLLFLLLPFAALSQGKWINLLDNPETRFHIWKTSSFDKWTFEDGILSTSGGNADLVSNDEFGDFELEFKFKVAPKGNSGIVYKVLEDIDNKALTHTFSSGPEYQIIDDENYPEKLKDYQKSGANYALDAPLKNGLSKPAGEWNTGKIEVVGSHVKHWLNGKLVADYEYGTDEWKEKVAHTKFAKSPYADPHPTGHIALQDHGDAVYFKKLRIRKL
ncbi:DUF1080 domain-containing protein [Marinilongibacter aquaticus]|uniref:3-keto-disaccharide hydrolase n=1 Tax=Marinilongibacter aquaticus TaxID=2975157 RepID=UPI0021BDD1D3|nr:DUF1080 domain-containing protein [Marinilongibacter aquaticus]UBM57344.1 DUF1080 domain-containing protein [Marinilongibacter aquaticus]